MNYKEIRRKFKYLWMGMDEIRDEFSPDDDEELAEIVMVIDVAIERAIRHCEESCG